jgi:GT2 family glycosyltransferase
VRYPYPSIPLTFTTIRRTPFEQIGGFDADFFVGHENNDLALRMLRAGYQVGAYEVRGAPCPHALAGASG